MSCTRPMIQAVVVVPIRMKPRLEIILIQMRSRWLQEDGTVAEKAPYSSDADALFVGRMLA